MRAAERLGKHRVGWGVARRELALVGVLVGTEERPAEALRATECAGGRRVDNWSGDGARRQAGGGVTVARTGRLGAVGIVFVGAQLILFRGCGRRGTWPGTTSPTKCSPPYRRRRRPRGSRGSSPLTNSPAGPAAHPPSMDGSDWCGIRASVPSSSVGTLIGQESRRAARAWRWPSTSPVHCGHSERWCAARRWAFIRNSPSTNAAIASVDRCSVDPNWRVCRRARRSVRRMGTAARRMRGGTHALDRPWSLLSATPMRMGIHRM